MGDVIVHRRPLLVDLLPQLLELARQGLFTPRILEIYPHQEKRLHYNHHYAYFHINKSSSQICFCIYPCSQGSHSFALTHLFELRGEALILL